jgi:CO dehydrogenase maturation factor
MIAVSGKGGSGKTMLVSIMIKVLARDRDLRILAIDADSAMSLPYTLGIKARKTVGDIRHQIIEEPALRTEIENTHISTVLSGVLEAGDGFSLLAMGRPEGPGCYCSVNDLLRYGIERLSRDYDLTIIDCEAGPEQINRRVTQGVDLLITVADATVRGLEAAILIKSIVENDAVMKSTRVGLVINKLKVGNQDIMETVYRSGLDILGTIPDDEHITAYDAAGKPLLNLPEDSPSVMAVAKILRSFAL